MIFQNVGELDENLIDVFTISDEDIEVKDQAKLIGFGIDYLIYSAVLSEDATVRHLCNIYIRKLASQKGVYSASLHPLYKAIGQSEVEGFTIPAMNVRTLVYDVAREVFKKLIQHETSAFIFELSRSEAKYTQQTQNEVTICVLAAAIKEGYQGPVFLQADHYQFDPVKYKEYPQGQIDEIQLAVKDALTAGFYNIDIDASTLVDLSLPEKENQQKENIEMTANLTKYIRKMQPSGIDVNIGGEIGHIGDRNSDVEDFEAFMGGYIAEIGDINGISKVSIATGTTHGGTPNPDGSIAPVNVDFEALKSISHIAKTKYGLAGAVQHGASTLPKDLFNKFPESGTVEIHLATGFQNIIYEKMPLALRDKIYQYTRENYADERKADWSDEQFIYKLRKKAFGPRKMDLWMMSEEEKNVIREGLAQEFETLFQKLNIVGTSHTIRKYIGEPGL